MSYNSTGLDQQKVSWINEIMDTCSISCFQLQEHFKASKTIESSFKHYFPHHLSYVKPGHREVLQGSGRAKGGLAQLCSKSLSVKKEKIATHHWRLQAQILHFKTYKIMWINCYFPTDSLTIVYSDQELIEVLAEIEKVLDNNIYDDCIIGGDFNFDIGRNSGFVNIIKQFLMKTNLISVWEKFDIDYTHVHTDMKSLSTIDHFFVNQRLLDLIQDAGPVHLGDNLSRHSPIMIKICLPVIPDKVDTHRAAVIRRPAWYKATQVETDLYRSVLTEKLDLINIPDSIHCCDISCKNINHIEDRDRFLLDLMSCLIEASYQCIPLTAKHGNKIGDTAQPLPGWNENIAPLKHDSKFWHAVWVSAGKPPSGSLHQVMAHCRRKYHHAVKRAKRHVNSIKSQNLICAAESGDRDFLIELKRQLPGKAKGQSFPECIEGKVTPETILEKFKECYQSLYNSAGSQSGMAEVKKQVDTSIGFNSLMEIEKLTGNLVKEACCNMKAGKLDVSGGFSSDVFLHSPDQLFNSLASIFRSFLMHGSVTPMILSCAFLPLFKGGFKNPEKFDSYRAIAGGSQILKLFEYVIIKLWGSYLETDSMQFGFKAGVSTTQCTWLVTEVTNYFMRRGTAVNACLLDCSKDFDKCRFDKLFQKLLEKGLPPVAIRVLAFIYEQQTGFIKLAGLRSNQFPITNGTRQGSVLSPLLFSVYLDDLIAKLRNLSLGCHIGGYWFGACGYADDLILLAPSRDVLQRMLQICEDYALQHNLLFSTDPVPSKSKTKCVYFCGRQGQRVKYPAPLKLDGKDLPWVESADHLGHTLHQLCSMDKDCQRAKNKYIAKSMDIKEDLAFATPEQQLRATQVYCFDAYGAMLWNLASPSSEQFFKCWNTSVKIAYRVPNNTYTYLVDGWLSGTLTNLRNQVLSRYPKFYRGLASSVCREVRGLLKIVENDPRSTTYKNLKLLRERTGLSQPQWFCASKIRSLLPTKTVPEKECWRLGLLASLFTLRSEKYEAIQDTMNITAMIHSLCNT